MPTVRPCQAGDDSSWEAYRELLRVLWLGKNKTLDQVMEFMSNVHGFHAEKWAYEAKFREWNFRKKLYGAYWRVIGDIINKRKLEGKDSVVFYYGTPVSPKKVQKEIMRKRAHPPRDTGDDLPPGVEIRTPKMVASNNVAQSKRASGRSTCRPLLPKSEPRSSHTDPTPWMLTDPCPKFTLDVCGEGWDVPCTPWTKDEVSLLNSITRDNNVTMLPFWATREGLLLQDLPWFRFHALLYSFGSLTVPNSPVQGVSGFAGDVVAEQFNQQERDLTIERAAEVTNAVTALKEKCGADFDLDEVMPEPFRIDVSNSSQAVTALSTNLSTLQLADVSLFLTANNLLDGRKLVALIERMFGGGQEHIFKKLFTLKSQTIQVFSCRILESISATSWWAGSDILLKRLLWCGLDRGILAGPTGGRCLQLAIHHKNEALALLLLENGVQKNPKLVSKEPFNRTPVELASFLDEQEVLRVLLGQDEKRVQRSLLVEPRRNEDRTALMKSCRDSDFEKIYFLLNGGLDVDCDRNSSVCTPILEWGFFNNRQCYDILLPYSQFAKHFWTVSGILSAANAGRQELHMYLAHKRCPEEKYPGDILGDAISDGLQYDMTQEIRTILSLELVPQELDLDLDMLLQAAASWGRFEIMTELVQLGADLAALDAVKDAMEDHLADALLQGPEKGCLKKLLDGGWFLLEDAFTINLERIISNLKQFENLKFLVEQGLNLNSAIFRKYDHKMRTPLQLTMDDGELEMVEYLIDAGASVNHTTGGVSHTALGEAVRLMRPEMVKFLLQREADVKVFANHHEMTLLELSVSRDSTKHQDPDDVMEVFQALLEAGADLHGPSRRKLTTNWNTTLTTAIMNPDAGEQIRLALDAGADIHQIGGGKMARTPLQAAAESGGTDIAKELLNRGAYVNAPAGPDHGRTALQAACGGSKKSTEMISLLLAAGADVSAPAGPSYGRTALQALCSSEAPSSELMNLLIERGADINAPPAKLGGITALQGAAIAGNIKIVMLLIDLRADVNAPPSECEGRMALDGAAEHGRLDTVQLLLTFGAKCIAPGSSGFDSAIRFAEENGHFVIADILRDTTANFNC